MIAFYKYNIFIRKNIFIIIILIVFYVIFI